MKRCPQCNRTYTDDALSFCLDDGAPLASISPPPAAPGGTAQYPSPRETSPQPQPTIAYSPGQMPPPQAPPAWSPMPPSQPRKRSVWPWLLGIGAIVVLMGIGLIVLIFVVASISNNHNNNRVSNNSNNGNSRLANRNSNSNTGNSNTNTSSLPASFSDDFSIPNWGSGPSTYGRTWYQNDEYHMSATKGGYIVMYSPKTAQYETKDATVRITVRNVDGTETSKGYGILVHAELKNDQLEDYGFLIDNGNKGYYRVVEHKAGVEVPMVSWKASSAIRTGTSPNQLEVRIRDLKLDFYINGQFVTSVADAEGYRAGKCGLYSSDTTEVAFDDLEISR